MPGAGLTSDRLKVFVPPTESAANMPINVKDPAFGAVGDGNAELATPFQNAYNAAKTLGRDVYIPAGTYYVSDPGSLCVIQVGRDNAGTAPKVRIIMESGVTIKLSANTPRFVDFLRTAANDLIHDFEIQGNGATIDCNSIGGHHHIICGTYGSGLNPDHLNFKRITIRNLKGINAPIRDGSDVNLRLWVDIHPSHSAAGQTQTVVEDVLVEGLRLEGGSQGVGVMGGNSGAATVGLDIRFDRITIRDCYHDTLVVPVAGSPTGANFQIGSVGYGGSCTVERCVAKGSGDVAYEIDGMESAVVSDCEAIDCLNPFYGTNYNNLQHTTEQVFTYRNCRARVLSASSTVGTGRSFYVESRTVNGTVCAAPRVVWDRCTHHRATTQAVGGGEGFYASGTLQGVTMKNCLAVSDGLSLTGSPGGDGSLVIVQNDGATRAKVVMHDNEVTVGGTYVSGTPTLNAVRLRGNLQLDVRGLTARLNVTSFGSNTARILDLGNSASSNLSGIVSGLEVLDSTGFSSIQQLAVNASTSLTIPDRLVIEKCIFTAQNQDVYFVDTTNMAKTILRDNVWATTATGGYKSVVVASTAALTAPAGGFVSVTGTADITSLTAGPYGAEVMLLFNSTAATTGVIDGSNLKLDGNFAYAANYTLGLRSDGTNWIEITRSAS